MTKLATSSIQGLKVLHHNSRDILDDTDLNGSGETAYLDHLES